jgi:hypothetical protein
MQNYMDHHSWLVQSNLLTSQMKDNIAMCGYCIVEDTVDSETSIDFNVKLVKYKITVSETMYNNLELLKSFNAGNKIGFFNTLKLNKFIEKKAKNDESGLGYDLDKIANNFVRAYLSDEWRAEIELSRQKTG